MRATEPGGLGIDAAKDRPEMLRLIGECITMWPFVEHNLAVALGILLGSNTEASLAVFSALKSSRVQQDAISAAAHATVDKKDQELVEAALIAIGSVEKIRNDLVHGQWGACGSIPNGLIWIAAKNHAPWNTAMLVNPKTQERDFYAIEEHFFVYTEDDLKEAIEAVRVAWRIGMDLFTYLRWPPSTGAIRDQLYDQLCNMPPIHEALTQLRKRKNK